MLGIMEHVHLIGIGGTGLSAIARLLLESGYTVSGSDQSISPLAEALLAAGIRIERGHRAENVQGANLVIRSSAIPDNNPEVQAALKAGIPVLKRADFLGRLMADRLGIAVAGTHGKTTTTAMIAWVLSALGKDPSYIIGGVSKNLGSNAHAGGGEAFVIEADEYDRMFLGLRFKAAIVTSIDHDHPDCYPTREEYFQAFQDFAGLVPDDGAIFICTDDTEARRLLQAAQQNEKPAFGYGILPCESLPKPLYTVVRWKPNKKGGYLFEAILNPHKRAAGASRVRVDLQVPGEHNVRNALAALALADWLGLPLDLAAQALSEYQGVERRFEVVGEAGGVIVISDYAHHPTEIRATLAAAGARYSQREIWAVWQPHTYSRTQILFDQFASAFSDADHVVVTEVYPAREPVSNNFSSRQVVAAMNHKDAHFESELAGVAPYLLAHLHKGDVLVVLSAGDADKVCVKVLAGLAERNHSDV
jgi:UDP-N-acetylmuramate--alanine ligase